MSTVTNFKVVPRLPSPASDGYLRKLIEKQPVCLVRVDLDGVLLAVNDAALTMLGATDLAEVLHASLVERFLAGRHDWWRDFAGRVWQEGSGSTECELLDLAGTTRNALLKGIAHWDHPDGIDSLFLTIRDMSAQVRLERAVHEALEVRQRSLQQLDVALREQERLGAELEQARSDGERLSAVVEQAEAERRDLANRCAECQSETLRTRDEQHRTELAANAHKAQELLDHLQEQLAAALCEQKRLAAGHHDAAAATRARQDDEEALAVRDARSQATITDLNAQLALAAEERQLLQDQLGYCLSAEADARQALQRAQQQHQHALGIVHRDCRTRMEMLEAQLADERHVALEAMEEQAAELDTLRESVVALASAAAAARHARRESLLGRLRPAQISEHDNRPVASGE